MPKFLETTTSIKREAGRQKKKKETTKKTQSPSATAQSVNERLTQKYGGGSSYKSYSDVRRSQTSSGSNNQSSSSSSTSTSRQTPSVSRNPRMQDTAFSTDRATPATAREMRQQRLQAGTQAGQTSQDRPRYRTAEEMSRARRDQKSGLNNMATAEQQAAARRAMRNTPTVAKESAKQALYGHGKTAADLTAANNSAAIGSKIDIKSAGFQKDIEKRRLASTAAAEKAFNELSKKQETSENMMHNATKDAKGLEKAYYGALESGTGMLTDIGVGALTGTGQAGSLAAMASRTYGSTRGQAQKEGATEREDRLYSALQAAKETGTELMFPGAGLARKAYGRTGRNLGEIASNVLLRNLKGKPADIASAALRLSGGVLEENAEEFAGWGLDPLIKEFTYGRNVRTRSAKAEMKERSDLLRANIESEEDARAAAAYLSSDSFIDETVKAYREAGLSQAEAEETAQDMREYLTASLTGDADRMAELEDKVSKKIAGKEKLKWDFGELKDTIAATTLLTATTGLPGSVSSSMKGAALRDNLGSEGVSALAKTAIDFEDEDMSRKAKAMNERIESGKELTATQTYDLMVGMQQQAERDTERETASRSVAQNTIRDEDLVTPYAVNQRTGEVIRDTVTEEKFQREKAIATEAINEVLSEQKESLTDTEIDTGSTAIANFQAGTFTVNDANALNWSNTAVRTAFEEATGLDLGQYTVKNKDGSVNIPATNAATKDALFAMAADNLVQSARAETANWMDNAKGEVVTQVTARMGSEGSVAFQKALDGVDERDRSTYMMVANASDMLYQTARNMGTSWENVKDRARQLFPGISEDRLEMMYDAGLKDRAAANYAAEGMQVQIGKTIEMNDSANKELKGKVFVNTAETPNGSTMKVFSEIASNLGVNIYLVDDLQTATGNQANGQYVDGNIYINVNSDFEQNIGYIFMHEVTHHIKMYAPEEYAKLENLVRETWFESNPEMMQTDIANRIALYKRNGQTLTEDQALEEIIADAAHEFLNDSTFAERVAEDNPSLAKAILNSVRDLLRKLRNILAQGQITNETHMNSLFSQLNILSEAEDLWLNAYAQAAKNQAAVGMVEWENNAYENEESRNSISRKMSDRWENGQKLTHSQFNSWYSAHKLTYGRADSENVNEVIDEIKNNGFISTSAIANVVPASINDYVDASKPNVTQSKYGAKKGDVVMLVPRPYVDMKNDLIKNGFKPRDYEIVTVERDYQPYYELYEKAYDDAGNVIPLNERFNQSSPDIRFSLNEPVERVKDLIAVHNLTASKLMGDFRLGGFPMPSIAVTNQNHENFGDISLLFHSDTIDPKKNRANKVYSADAWTPTVPQTDYEADHAVVNKAYNTVKDLVGEEPHFKQGISSYLHFQSVEEDLKRRGGFEGFIDFMSEKPFMKYAFLKSKGENLEIPKKEVTEEKDWKESRVDLYKALLSQYGTDGIYDLLKTPMNDLYERDDVKAFIEEHIASQRPRPERANLRIFGQSLSEAIMYDMDETKTIGTKMVDDYSAAERELDRRLDQKEFRSWLENLFEGVIAQEGVYNGKDIFTPSGNRRSFAQTHYPANLEGILRAMKEQGEKNISNHTSTKTLRADLAKSFKSLAEIRDNEGKLKNLTEEEVEAIYDEIDSKFHSILRNIGEKSEREYDLFTADYIANVVSEIVQDNITSTDKIIKKFDEYGWKASEKDVQNIKDLLDAIESMPVNMFEAKPRRAVGFDEVKAAVIPASTEEDIKQGLSDRGIQMYEYDPNVEGDRIEKVNEAATAQGLRFSISEDSSGKELTAGQKAFFAQSKATNEDGNLLTLYHGTGTAGFNTFDTTRNSIRPGLIWLTTSRQDADSYAGNWEHKLYDPNEQETRETVTVGDYNLSGINHTYSYMRFDREEERQQFIEEHPDIDKAHDFWELSDLNYSGEISDAELSRLEEADRKIRRDYSIYEASHFTPATWGDVFDHPERFDKRDLVRAIYAYDSNASIDEEEEDTKESLLSFMRYVNSGEEYGDEPDLKRDIPFEARIPVGETGEYVHTVNNRTYEVYANITNPLEVDLRGSGIEGNYGYVDELLNGNYDGLILRNCRVGRYHDNGDVVIARESSQVKLTTNENPSTNPDIRYSINSDGEELTQGQADYFANSQARDEQGRLIVLYHSSPEVFYEFDSDMRGENTGYDNTAYGFFVTDDPKFSSRFGENQMKLYANINKLMISPFGARMKYSAEECERITREWIELIDPEQLEHYEEAREDDPELSLYEWYNDLWGLGEDPNEYAEDYRDWLEDAGYDAIEIFEGTEEDLREDGTGTDRPVTTYAVFNSNQLKDIRNTDPTNIPDIRYSTADDESTMTSEANKAKSLDELWIENPVERECAIRKKNGKIDFINSVTTKWNPAWLPEGAVLDTNDPTTVTNVRDVIMGAMRGSDTKVKYRNEMVQDTLKECKRAYYAMKKGNHSEAADILYDHAFKMVENLEFFVDDDQVDFERWKTLREYIRTTKFTLPEKNRGDIDPSFRKTNYGRILLGSNGIDPTSAFSQLNEIWPEFFPEDMKQDPAGILMAIEKALDSCQPMTKAYSSDECIEFAGDIADSLYDIIYEGKEYKSLADRYKDKANAMKARHAEAMRQMQENLRSVKEQHREEIRQLKAKNKQDLRAAKKKSDFEIAQLKQNREYNIKRLKAEKERAIKEERERSRQKIAEERERKAHAELFRRVNQEYKDLTHRLLNPSKDRVKNIPEPLRVPLAKMLMAFDLEKMRSKELEEKYGLPTKAQLNFRELKDSIEKVAKEEGEGSDYDLVYMMYADKMSEIAENVDGLTIDYLTSDDIAVIENLLKGIDQAIKNHQKLIMEGENRDAQEVRNLVGEGAEENEALYGRAKKYKGLRKFLDNILNMGELTPIYFFSHIKGMYDMYRQLRSGFDQYVRNEKDIQDKLTNILSSYYKTNRKGQLIPGSEVEEWRHSESAQTFEISNNQAITLTTAQVMSLYCLSKREQAKGHMMALQGGVVASETEAGSKIAKAQEYLKGIEVEHHAVVLASEDIHMIVQSLTPEQMHVADQLQELMSKDMAALGNKASMALLSVEMYKDEQYFPIKVQQDVLPTNVDKINIREKIRNPGFSKPLTKGANNAIVVDDIFSVVATHCNEMNLYSSYAVPIRNFMQVYNGNVELKNGQVKKTKEVLRQAYGDKAIEYIENFVNDINGNSFKRQGGLDDVLDAALGQAKKAAVFANLRVAIQQPTAIVRAFAVMNAKYFKGVKPSRKATQEMLEHCPIALWKSWGYYDTHFGRDIEDVMMGTNRPTKISYLMSEAYGSLDNMTWGMIWQAVKNEVKAENPNVEEGSDEFWNLCNERASFVFDRTQVVDSPFHRSNDMRSKNGLVKQLTSFQAEPTLSFNVLRQGIVDAYEASKKGNKSKAKKALARVILVWVGQAVTVAVAQSLVDALRRKGHKDDDDDEDEVLTWYEEMMKYFELNLFSNFADDVNPINNIYFIKDIVPPIMNALEGEYVFGSQNLALQWVDTITNGITQCKKKWEKGESYKKSWYDCLTELFGGIGALTGVPVKTGMRGGKNLVHWLNKITGANVFAEDGTVDSAVDSIIANHRKADGDEEGDSSSGSGDSNGTGSAAADALKDVRKITTKIGKNTAKKMPKSEEQLLSEIKEKTIGLSGQDKKDKIWDIVGDGYTKYVDAGDYGYINKMRNVIEKAGGDVEAFDKKVLDASMKSYKKTITSDPTQEQLDAQKHIRDYLTEHGVTEQQISSEICYKTYTARDLKAALRMGNKEYILDELRPLIQAGLTYEDFERLYKNRNYGAKTYDGKYSDPKYKQSSGTYSWPISGQITSRFGYRSSPGGIGSTNHMGIDIAGSMGDPIGAADGGTVIYVGWQNGGGNIVQIRHDDGSITEYKHMSGFNCNQGDQVAQGQTIGFVGSTGNSTGPHLHFGYMDPDGNYHDPLEYLNAS